MSPQFSKQSTRPLSPRAYAAAVRRARQMLDQIEALCEASVSHDACDERCGCTDCIRHRRQLTRAIHGLSMHARNLSRRHRGLSVDQELDETASSFARRGGQAGTGESKRRDQDDPDYYSRIAQARWKKSPHG